MWDFMIGARAFETARWPYLQRSDSRMFIGHSDHWIQDHYAVSKRHQLKRCDILENRRLQELSEIISALISGMF